MRVRCSVVLLLILVRGLAVRGAAVAAPMPARVGGSSTNCVKFQVGRSNAPELVISMSFSHFASCRSFSADFQRFIRALTTSEG